MINNFIHSYVAWTCSTSDATDAMALVTETLREVKDKASVAVQVMLTDTIEVIDVEMEYDDGS